MLKYVKIAAVTGVTLFALGTTSVEAATITGSFSMSNGVKGSYLPVNGETGVAALLQAATGLDFTTAAATPSPGAAGQFQVSLGPTGDFSGLTGTVGLIQDFTFTGLGSVNYPVVTIPNFESFGGFTFDLTSVAITMQNAAALDLFGLGTFKKTGFTDTPGTFDFTANQQGATYSFSASQTTSSPVPEPASMILLGTGLIGLGTSARRRWAPRKA